MVVFSFLCPYSGFHVHAWSKGEDVEGNRAYETVICTVCQQVHLVNSDTDRVVGQTEEE